MSLTNNSSCLCFVLDSLGALQPAVSGEECGKLDGAFTTIGKRTHADTLGLKILEGTRDVKETLAAGANHRDGGPSQLCEIGCCESVWF